MPIQTSIPPKREATFIYLLLLTGFFFLLEISFFIQANKAYLGDFSWVSNQIHLPLSIVPGIIFFGLAQILVHFVFTCIVYVVSRGVADCFFVSANKQLRLATYIWLVMLITGLLANQVYFPYSKFSELTGLIFVTPRVTQLFFLLFLSISIGLALIAGFQWSILIFKQCQRRPAIYYACLLGFAILVVSSFLTLTPANSASIPQQRAASRPNIILIGADSLRPDFLGFFGSPNQTPFFDQWLSKAVVFSEAITPLARTFPSWTSILTGEYPRLTGIRSNLDSQDRLNLTNTLPAILKRDGYETIYATDETRFSNVDKNFGFDQVISPPMGLNDFLLGTFNDFPFSNLMVNTWVGYWLFPHSYANRPVYFTYEPNTFLRLLTSHLHQSANKPLFLAVHFCLTHAPYAFAQSSAIDLSVPAQYAAGVQQVDQQIRDFMAILQKKHLLDHAIVVILSDHGEALELPGDRITEQSLFVPSVPHEVVPDFYPPSLDHETVDESAGHGTDVLGLTQYHTLLAFRLYGFPARQPARIISGVVSLLDIKPTVLGLLHLPSPESSGMSLGAVIQGEINHVSINRNLFLESDFSPQAIRTVYPDTRQVLLEGVRLFKIDPMTTRLTVKPSMAAMILHSKQYAVIRGHWMLALYPQSAAATMPVLVNLDNGAWTNDLLSAFAAKAPAMMMLDALKAFYGNEINRVCLAKLTNCSHSLDKFVDLQEHETIDKK